MEVVTLSNQKGGVGKTTTAFHLATGLYGTGKRVLLVDLDAQTNLAFTAGVDLMSLETTLYDVFRKQAAVHDAVMPLKAGFDILVGGLDLTAADMEFTAVGREYMLSESLEPLQDEYDYCIIDTPPTLGVLTMNALTASDKVIIPIQADAYSLQGMQQLSGFIGNVQKYSNKGLVVDGLLITRYDSRTAITKALDEQIRVIADSMGTKVYNAKIRNTVNVAKAALLQTDLYSLDSKNTASLDYMEFVQEFLAD